MYFYNNTGAFVHEWTQTVVNKAGHKSTSTRFGGTLNMDTTTTNKLSNANNSGVNNSSANSSSTNSSSANY